MEICGKGDLERELKKHESDAGEMCAIADFC